MGRTKEETKEQAEGQREGRKRRTREESKNKKRDIETDIWEERRKRRRDNKRNNKSREGRKKWSGRMGTEGQREKRKIDRGRGTDVEVIRIQESFVTNHIVRCKHRPLTQVILLSLGLQTPLRVFIKSFWLI